MINIDYRQVKLELEKKNLYDIQKKLTFQRKTRTITMTLLLFSLLLTLVFGMLENPIVYTLSNIGNFFSHRIAFILWSIIAGISIQLTVCTLFKLEKYITKYGFIFIGLSAFFLVATGIIPALKEEYPVLHLLHTITSGLHALFLYLALVPFSLWISKENPRLRITILVWQLVIWAGSIVMVILFWHSALFELWFFVSNIVFLLYLSLILFEEEIIKTSARLLTNEENLNIAIEKIFVNLESKKHKEEIQSLKNRVKCKIQKITNEES